MKPVALLLHLLFFINFRCVCNMLVVDPYKTSHFDSNVNSDLSLYDLF